MLSVVKVNVPECKVMKTMFYHWVCQQLIWLIENISLKTKICYSVYRIRLLVLKWNTVWSINTPSTTSKKCLSDWQKMRVRSGMITSRSSKVSLEKSKRYMTWSNLKSMKIKLKQQKVGLQIIEGSLKILGISKGAWTLNKFLIVVRLYKTLSNVLTLCAKEEWLTHGVVWC